MDVHHIVWAALPHGFDNLLAHRPRKQEAAGGALVGLINGIGVARFGVPPIIMTLAANVILQGLILVLTGGSPTPSAPE